MKDIERKNGFINLDNYFKDKYNLDKVEINTLDSKNIINPEYKGASLSFWFYDNNDNILFKDCENFAKAFIELINEEFIKNIGLESAHYDLAIFNNYVGVITYDFEKDNYKYEDLYSILCDYNYDIIKGNESKYDLPVFLDNNDATNKFNNLDDIWYALEHHYENNLNKQKIVYKIMKDLIKLFIFDLFMNQSDRHCSNYMICTNLNNENDVLLGPIFDYSDSLYTRKKEKNNLSDSIMPDISNYNSWEQNSNEHIILTFLNKSSIGFRDMFYQTFNQLTPEKFLEAIEKVEERCETKIPFNIKKRICMNFLENFSKISDIINNYKEREKNNGNSK